MFWFIPVYSFTSSLIIGFYPFLPHGNLTELTGHRFLQLNQEQTGSYNILILLPLNFQNSQASYMVSTCYLSWPGWQHVLPFLQETSSDCLLVWDYIYDVHKHERLSNKFYSLTFNVSGLGCHLNHFTPSILNFRTDLGIYTPGLGRLRKQAKTALTTESIKLTVVFFHSLLATQCVYIKMENEW